ncbi:type II secretion system F family protein [Aquipuribacter sp. MA13-6]|uniref:type II secretion system F family protein n=1 Tax=unclassified Aquipuribacter TaxID=2635084 RepID=UPI003EEB3DA1
MTVGLPAGRAARSALVALGGLLVASLLGAAPAGAAPPEDGNQPVVRITDIGATGSDLRFIVTSSGLPEGTDLSQAAVDVAFEPSGGDAVPLESDQTPVAESVVVPRQTAVLAVDVSGSLQDEGLEDVRDAVDVFLATVPPEVAVGLVTFEAPPVARVQPTTDREAVRDQLAALELANATGLHDAVVTATEMLPPDGSRRVVLLTDGEDEGPDGGPGSVASLEDAVAAVQASGAELTAIGFREGAPREALQALATAGRGQLVDAAEGDDLDAAFDVAATSFATELEVTAQVPPELAGRRGNVRLSVGTGELTLTDQAFATLVDTAPETEEPSEPAAEPSEVAAPPLRDVPAVEVSLGGPVVWAGLAGLFLALATIVVVLVSLGRRRDRPEAQRQRQLSYYTLGGARAAGGDPAPVDQVTRLGDNAVARSAVQLADRVVERRGGLAGLSRRLEVADVPLRPAEWVVLQVGIAVAAGLLLLLVSGVRLPALLVGVVLGAVGPVVYLSLRGSRRRGEFLRLLPETLGLVASGLRAGYSVSQALEAVVKEGQEPMRSEFHRALVEARLGVTVDDALQGIADRMQSQDFAWVVMAIRIHNEVGGNLSEILDTVGATLRERSRLRRQVDVLSAEGRLSAWIIGLLPVVFTGYLLLTRPDYLLPLVQTDLGLALLALGGVLFGVGVLGLRWAVKVDV